MNYFSKPFSDILQRCWYKIIPATYTQHHIISYSMSTSVTAMHSTSLRTTFQQSQKSVHYSVFHQDNIIISEYWSLFQLWGTLWHTVVLVLVCMLFSRIIILVNAKIHYSGSVKCMAAWNVPSPIISFKPNTIKNQYKDFAHNFSYMTDL